MSDQDETLGFLKAIVERNSKQLDRLTDLFERNVKKETERTEQVLTEIQDMRNELNMYKTAIKVAKALGWTAAFILAFKFGDIPDLWED